MSRSNYTEDNDEWALIRWRGAVLSAIRGKRGRRFFEDLITALDAMPEKALIAEELIDGHGGVCALGAVAVARGLPVEEIDPEEPEDAAQHLDIAEALAREVSYVNDEWGARSETPEQRWQRVRDWATKQLADGLARARWIQRDRPWSEYPVGTKAHWPLGGHWLRVTEGWQWSGDQRIHDAPDKNLKGRCIELADAQP